MKNSQLLLTIMSLSMLVAACSKGSDQTGSQPISSFYFTANDTLVIYTVNEATIEDIYSLKTTLITGQYADTSSKQGSLSIRVLGDTTGRYAGDSLMVTYMNAAGTLYYNTQDPANYVVIDRYEKKYNGMVSGQFALKLTDGVHTINCTNGAFKSLYQE